MFASQPSHPERGGQHEMTPEGETLLSGLTKMPMFNASEELELTRELKRQRQLLREIESCILEETEPQQLIILGRERIAAQVTGDEIANKLFNANIRWALKLANNSNRLEFLDRFQWAALGLWRAIRLYDPDYLVDGKSVRISTYATWWIRQHMQRGADSDERLIRIPNQAKEVLNTLARARTAFEEEFGRPANDLRELCDYAMLDEKRVSEFLAVAEFPLSLDMSYASGPGIAPGTEGTLMDILPDTTTSAEDHFLEEAGRNYTAALVREALDDLEAFTRYDDRKQKDVQPYIRHAAVIRLRFRIGEPVLPGQEPCRTLEEVGRLITPPVTRERARQLQRQGLRWIVENKPELLAHFEGTIED
jgi:RNA polymerase primary sigma factor